jgi:beta-galactosidase/beta-glucuronidase
MRSSPIRRWLFLLADEPEASAKGFDDSLWRPVVVPHDWSIEHAFDPACSSGTGYLPGGVGWYRGHVSLAELGLIQRLRLVFHGVYKNADVWVNGYHLGSRPSGYARFSFDLSELLAYAPDDDLVVAVRVDRTEVSDSRWYNGSRLTRRVDLEVHDAEHIHLYLAEHGTTVETMALDEVQATLRVRHVVVNDGDEDANVTLDGELRSLTSDRLHRFAGEVRVPRGETREVEMVEQIAGPEPWSDEHPHLYRLTTTLRHGPAFDVSELVVGLRTISFDPGRGFFVNGEARTLKGVCLHEDAGVLGTAVPAAVWARRLLSLKGMGCNAVRMAHNPHAPELYTLCDALGFYVVDEAFDEWENPKNKWWQGHNVYPPRHEGPAKDFPAWHAADLTAMVEAHRHPLRGRPRPLPGAGLRRLRERALARGVAARRRERTMSRASSSGPASTTSARRAAGPSTAPRPACSPPRASRSPATTCAAPGGPTNRRRTSSPGPGTTSLGRRSR